MSAVSSLLLCQSFWVQNTSTQSNRKSTPLHRDFTWLEKAQVSSPALSETYRHQTPYRPAAPFSRPDEPPATAVPESPSIWDDEAYKRITLAKLVKGVYELEHKRLAPSTKKDSPVRLWWESLNFELVGLHVKHEQQEQHQPPPRSLRNDADEKSINLAVYRWKPTSAASPPPQKVVIAIRGTLPRVDDGWHNMHIPLQRLHETPRYEQIMGVVKTAVAAHGSQDVCIVGHSLGAALGLLVARTLVVEEDIKIESHLFNPVYPYTWLPGPHELIENEVLWSTVRAVRYAAAAGLTHLLVDPETREKVEADFLRLQEWNPHLYINKGDPMCRGYLEYFVNHERLARQGLLGARVSAMAAPYSTRGLIFQGSKPMHLVPSAVLHVCPGAGEDYWSDLSDRQFVNHNLKNWWVEDIQVATRHVRLSSW